MEAVRIETTVQPNRRIVVEDLPFDEGDKVEIIILEAKAEKEDGDRYPLRGTPYSYVDPFSPAVPAEDWDVVE